MERLVPTRSSLFFQEPCLLWALRGRAVPALGRRVRSWPRGVQWALSLSLSLSGQGGLRCPVPVPAEGSCHRSRSVGPEQRSSRAPWGHAGSAEGEGTQPFLRLCSWRDTHLSVAAAGCPELLEGLSLAWTPLVLGDAVRIHLALCRSPLPGDSTVPVGSSRDCPKHRHGSRGSPP